VTPESGSAPAFDQLLRYIDADLGFSTAAYNRDYLGRRVGARLRRTDTDDYATYHRLLQRDPDERAALLDALSVNVTSFYRNPEVWSVVRDALRTLTVETTGTVRVWSAACSDGREAYSVAMLALSDPQVDDRRLEIVGTDIKESILEAARNGVYHAADGGGLAGQLEGFGFTDDYVEWSEDRLVVGPEAKRLVTFRRHDLLREPPLSGVDLLLCRNFLIYVDGGARDDLFAAFARALRPGGYLVLGMTETLPASARDAFETVEGRKRFYRLRTGEGG
jgi:chemotaxis protein methyltransferase CheR